MMIFGCSQAAGERCRSEEDPFLLLESPTPPSGHGLPLWIDRAPAIAVKMDLARCFGHLTFLL